MRTTFQIIKAFAIVLAVMIIVSIVGAAVAGVEALGLLGHKSETEHTVVADAGYTDVRELDINVKATELKIIETDDDPVRVETTSKYIDQWQDGDTLHITERSHGIFGWNAVGVTTIYLHKNAHFKHVNLEVGAGTLTATARISTQRLAMDLGAGHATIEDLYVNDQAKIETGTGLLEVHHGKVKDLDLEMGVGKVAINLHLVGDSKIQTGTGKLELGLDGSRDDYKILVHKGLGSVTLDGADLRDDEKWGSGLNQVEIESGVGAVEITTKAEKKND